MNAAPIGRKDMRAYGGREMGIKEMLMPFAVVLTNQVLCSEQPLR